MRPDVEAGGGAIDAMDATWRQHLDDLAPGPRARALRVGAAMGLVRDGAPRWDDFVRHAPNRALPRFVAPASAECEAGAYVRAHHQAAFFWMLLDRVADRQVARDDEVRAVRHELLGAWSGALARALGDRASARRAIARDLRLWRLGVALDRAATARGDVTPQAYATSVWARLRCVSTCARAMLEGRGMTREAAALTRANDWFMLACQCRDDALDVEEDRRCRGASVPELLGVVPGALVRAASRFVVRAREEAARGGLDRFAAWLDGFARDANVAWAGDDGAAQVFGAMALVTGITHTTGGDA